jgi:hypothetical protein
MHRRLVGRMHAHTPGLSQRVLHSRVFGPPPGALRTSKFEDDRAGAFHTQVFERSGRYEPEVAEALTDRFVSGTSTHRVGKVAKKRLGVAKSASSVSRLTQALTEP